MTTENVTVYEGKRYREVARRANVGELVKVVEPCIAEGKYTKGSILTVTDRGETEISVKGIDIGIFHSEYVVLEPIIDADELRQMILDLMRRVDALEARDVWMRWRLATCYHWRNV